MSGVHKNPRTIIDKLPKAESIDSIELDRFRSQTGELTKRFDEMNGSQMLSLNPPSAD